MALNTHWTGNAKKQLKNIFESYSKNASLKGATKLSEDIVKQTLKLKEHPKIGTIEPYLLNKKQGFRFLVFKNFKIIYWVNEKKNIIDISDIFDTRQNPIKLKRN